MRSMDRKGWSLCSQHFRRRQGSLRRIARREHRGPHRLRRLHHPLDLRRRRLLRLSHRRRAQRAPGAARHARGVRSSRASAEAERSACLPALGRCLFVQAVTAFHRASQQRSEESDEAAAFMRKLQWELDKISRDLVACGITCLTLFGEGDAATPQAESARTRRWWSRCTREPSETHAVCVEQHAVLVQMCR